MEENVREVYMCIYIYLFIYVDHFMYIWNKQDTINQLHFNKNF